MIYQSAITLLLMYFFVRNTRLDKNNKVRIFGVILVFVCSAAGVMLKEYNLNQWYYQLGVITAQIGIFTVYLVFYNNDIFQQQLKWFIPLCIGFVFASAREGDIGFGIFILTGLWATFINKEKLNIYGTSLLVIISMVLGSLTLRGGYIFECCATVISFDLYMFFTQNENSKNMNMLQRKFLSQQYEEIKNVYLNMRGWRHDYHNHIQAMKAYISMNQIEELNEYLLKLENELVSIDNMVQSGNIMMDAILNSKISIMKEQCIDVEFKAVLPENMKVNDVDMCIIVSNLLENAIEACLKIEEERRFIRIFAEVYGSQFYLSIQNSAEEELSFDQRNYISTKRGEHGLGMKRVAFLVEKYEGFLNLKNEPGIFASEITIPF